MAQTSHQTDDELSMGCDVRFEITADRAVTFPLQVRIPAGLVRRFWHGSVWLFGPCRSARSVRPGRHAKRPSAGWVSVENIPIGAAAAAGHWSVKTSVHLPMPVRRVIAHVNVKDDAGKAAIQRGPVLYAIESRRQRRARARCRDPVDCGVFRRRFTPMCSAASPRSRRPCRQRMAARRARSQPFRTSPGPIAGAARWPCGVSAGAK